LATLVDTVAAYLRSCSEQAAAGELGVHRHTVRNRLARAETLPGAGLNDPDVRAELWLALRLTGQG
jgi:purine catabolism regulator